MTSEDARREASDRASGEDHDPRDSEDARREASDRASGEDHDPRDSEDARREASDRSAEISRSDTTADVDDVPLDIVGRDADDTSRGEEKSDESIDDDSGGEDGADPMTTVLSEFDIPESRPDEPVRSQSDTEADVEPVELLVQLAEDGEIDPWDIDVVTVTDKFLMRLDESDLRTGGRALFYASVLLRMKSDAMWVDDEESADDQAPAEEPWEMPAGEDPPVESGIDPFDELEREMDRRIERKTARGMPETLDELVRDLRERERDTWWKESRSYDTSESPTGYSRGTQTLDYRDHDDLRMDDEPSAADVTGTAHDEHMEDVINDVFVELQRHYDEGRDEVLFAEIREAGGSVVNTFLGVLFLSHRGRVRLQQDDLFDDLWIRDPAAMSAEEVAAADV